jgi:hypothetical protein
MRRAFGHFRNPGPVLHFIAGPEGLSVRAASADVAIEYRGPSRAPAENLWLPFAFLADCEGKSDEPVQLEAAGPGRVAAQWRSKSVPQIVQYDAMTPADAEKFPAMPATCAENAADLLQALRDAGETTDPGAVRYALECMQLRPSGQIGATDGRHLLVQSGFRFPWEEDLLVPHNKVFASPELPRDQPVRIGRTEDWVAVGVGPWTVWLKINKDGRFPDLSRHVYRDEEAKTQCRFSSVDAEFLGETLPQLPCDDTLNDPITVELNGHVAIRAKAADQPRPTELVLSNSTWTGEPVRINTNRKYLARAMKLGLQEFCVFSDSAALMCRSDRKQYACYFPAKRDACTTRICTSYCFALNLHARRGSRASERRFPGRRRWLHGAGASLRGRETSAWPCRNS